MVKTYGWVLCLVFLGCGSTDVTATGPKAPPRPLTCDFEILTSLPMSGYQEIGTVDVTPGGYGVNQFTSLGDFKDHIRENVCQLGGDAAFASANGFGMYIKASVLKHVDAPAPAPGPVAAAEAPRKPAGCEFDTQCKGDRVCIDGKCMTPEPKAAAPAEASPVTAPVVSSAAPPAKGSTTTTTPRSAASKATTAAAH